MKRLLLLLLLIVTTIGHVGAVTGNIDSLFHYMRLSEHYEQQTEARIARLEARLGQSGADTYAVYDELFGMTRSYHYDRAYKYVQHLSDEAQHRQDPNKIAHAEICKGFLYLSAGLFKEGYDLLSRINVAGLERSVVVDYYTTYARLLYDMADYTQEDLRKQYVDEGNRLTRSALQYLTPRDTAMYWRCKALYDQHMGMTDRSIARYQQALKDSRIGDHDRAICLSTIASLYASKGNTSAEMEYMIEAAIADIRSSTKETVAMRIVAERLYGEGDLDRAVACIKHAETDAQFYNARHRQVEISQILPIIEQEHIRRLREWNLRVNIALACLAVLLVVMLIGGYFYLRRNRQLKQARQTIEQMNESLLLANRVKEEYIASFLCWQSSFLSDMQKYQRHVKRAAEQKQWQDLVQVPKSLDASLKREHFNRQFDQMFLRIFPHYVSDFNALLRPDSRIELAEGELLNTDLRIAALIRLGIHQNEVIAQVLDYSINTIYAYKTKLRNRTDLSNEEFEKRIMAIPSWE